MSAGNFTLYNNAKLLLFNGGLNMAGDTITAALLTSSYTPSAAHSTWADVSATEVAAGGDYAQQALSGESVSGASGTVTVDSGDISFGTNVTITAKYLVLVKGTAGSLTAASELIGYCDLNTGGGSVSSTAGGFAVNTPNGLFTAT